MPQPGPQPRPIIPPPPTQGNGFGAGLSQFIEAYKGERKSKKQQAAANFDKHLALLQQGLPGVDLKKMAKWAREAGLEFDYESPAPPPQPQAQAPQQPAAPQGPQGMPPGAAPGMPMGGMPGRPPQQAPRPPQPQGGPPQDMMPQGAPPQAAGGSGRGGIFKRLGAAMGVPQPPTASQQRGTMAMLQEMKKRGQMSQEMKALEVKYATRAKELALEMDAMLGADISPESPEFLTKMAQFEVITKGMMGGKTGELLDQEKANKIVPRLARLSEERAATEAKAKKESEVTKLATDWMSKNGMDLAQIVGVADGTIDPKEVDTSSIGTEKQNELFLEMVPATQEKYTDAAPEAVVSYVAALAKGNWELAAKIEDELLGETLAEKREKRAGRGEGRANRQLAVSEEGLDMRKTRKAEEKRIKELAGGLLAEHAPSDPKSPESRAEALSAAAGDAVRYVRSQGGSAADILAVMQELKSSNPNVTMLQVGLNQ